MARNLLEVRAARKKCFPAELFDEHAWDLLLHLFIALSENEMVSEADLLARASCRGLVGQSWLAHLVKAGQIVSRSEGANVEIADAAIASMRRFLDTAAHIHATAGS